MKLSEIQLEGIFSSMREALIVVDREFKITFMNQAAAILLFIAPLTASGKDIDEVAQIKKMSDANFSARGLIAQVLKDISIVRFSVKDDLLCSDKEKRIFPIALEITSLLEGGEITGALILIRDITEEKNLDRAKSEFLSLASHQLRSPLTQASWYVELLLSEDSSRLTKTQKEYLDRVYESTKHMTEIVDDLLTLSRIELGLIAIHPSLTKITNIADDAITKLHDLITSRRIKFSKFFDETIPSLNLDSKIMNSILYHTLSYAIRGSPHDGGVSLQISKLEGNLTVTIRDSGEIIRHQEKKLAFGAVFHMTHVEGEEVHATGLELHLAEALVQQSGGTMFITENENKDGNVFYIMFSLDGMKEKHGIASVV